MASLLKSPTPLIHLHNQTNNSSFTHFSLLPSHKRISANSAPNSFSKSRNFDNNTPNLLKRPIISPPLDSNNNGDDDDDESEKSIKEENEREGESHWLALEDQILEDTVPLVNIVRLILHSTNKYKSGERLRCELEKLILERLLPYHPQYQLKIGSGIDYITVGYHPDYASSRCLFVVKIDGELVDFSYWKCIKGMLRKNYPLITNGYIFKQIRQRMRTE